MNTSAVKEGSVADTTKKGSWSTGEVCLITKHPCPYRRYLWGAATPFPGGSHKMTNCVETKRCFAYIKPSQKISFTVNLPSQHWQLQEPGLFLHLILLIAISPILPCFKHRTEFKCPFTLLQCLLLSKLVSA